jgi:general secretion pathway protein K
MINKFPIQQKSTKQQKGLALISVLLIFAIVAVLAGAMIERQSLDIQRSGNLQALQQARAYSSGIEYAVRSGLQLDYENSPDIDHPLEEWAKPHTYPLQPGTAEIQIIDAQSRFNLNGLHKSATDRAAQIQRFKNLLGELGLDPTIADRTQKFMDEDSLVDNDYLSEEIPYRASYNLFKHPSELLLVKDVDGESYRKLTPYITALPVSATLNVNTASNKVLASLSTAWSLSEADSVIGNRGDKGIATVDEFWDLSEVEQFKGGSSSGNNSNDQNPKEVWDKADFSVNSQYFEVFAKVTLADRVATVEMLIYRDTQTGEMRTFYRDYSRTEARIPAASNTNSNAAGSSSNATNNNSNTTNGSGGI